MENLIIKKKFGFGQVFIKFGVGRIYIGNALPSFKIIQKCFRNNILKLGFIIDKSHINYHSRNYYY